MMNLHQLRQRFWWFDVLYPITLGVGLFSLLTFIIFDSQKQMRLALMAEDEILSLSLHGATALQTAADPSDQGAKVLSVGISKDDLAVFGVTSGPKTQDVPISSYVLGLKALAAAKVPLVFLRLVPGIHDLSPTDYDALTTAISTLDAATKVILVFPRTQMAMLPESLRTSAKIVDDGVCQEFPKLQIRCPFNEEWSDWVVQALWQETAHMKRALGEPMPANSWVSEQFATLGASFIVNLPPPQTIDQVDLHTLLSRVKSPGLGKNRPLAAFLGQSFSAADAPPMPGHLFWAQLAKMFFDDQMVHVPTHGITLAVALAFCALIVTVLHFFGGAAALGMFIVYVLLGPVANALSIRYAHVYVPLFDSYYFGLATLVIAGFGKLSLAAFARWRMDERRRLLAYTADVKGNFISLLSHNLNTPIAKMQGTLSLLSMQPSPGEWRSDVRKAEALVAQLELVVKAVLISTALDEKAVNITPISLARLKDEFQNLTGGTLKRLGVEATIELKSADPDEMNLPLKIDMRSVSVAIAAAVALFASQNDGTGQEPTTIQLIFELDSPSIPDLPSEAADLSPWRIAASISCQEKWLPSSALSILMSDSITTLRGRISGDFTSDVLAGLAVQVARAYHGAVGVTPLGRGGRVVLSFRPVD